MGKKKNKSQLRSNCCNAEIKVDMSSDFIEDNSKNQIIGTCCYMCTKCNQPCDAHTNERKFWTRNPKTQIIGDKREKHRIKEAKKEIDSTGCA